MDEHEDKEVAGQAKAEEQNSPSETVLRRWQGDEGDDLLPLSEAEEHLEAAFFERFAGITNETYTGSIDFPKYFPGRIGEERLKWWASSGHFWWEDSWEKLVDYLDLSRRRGFLLEALANIKLCIVDLQTFLGNERRVLKCDRWKRKRYAARRCPRWRDRSQKIQVVSLFFGQGIDAR